MSLTTCPECGHQVSSQAPACPACGYPIMGDPVDRYIEYRIRRARRGCIAGMVIGLFALLAGTIKPQWFALGLFCLFTGLLGFIISSIRLENLANARNRRP